MAVMRKLKKAVEAKSCCVELFILTWECFVYIIAAARLLNGIITICTLTPYYYCYLALYVLLLISPVCILLTVTLTLIQRSRVPLHISSLQQQRGSRNEAEGQQNSQQRLAH